MLANIPLVIGFVGGYADGDRWKEFRYSLAFILGLSHFHTYALGHTLLMLVAGRFTGFVEGFVKARGVVNFSLWAKRVSGVVVMLAGGWFVWQGW